MCPVKFLIVGDNPVLVRLDQTLGNSIFRSEGVDLSLVGF